MPVALRESWCKGIVIDIHSVLDWTCTVIQVDWVGNCKKAKIKLTLQTFVHYFNIKWSRPKSLKNLSHDNNPKILCFTKNVTQQVQWFLINKYNDCEQEESTIPLAIMKFNHLFWFHLCSRSEIKNNQWLLVFCKNGQC